MEINMKEERESLENLKKAAGKWSFLVDPYTCASSTILAFYKGIRKGVDPIGAFCSKDIETVGNSEQSVVPELHEIFSQISPRSYVVGETMGATVGGLSNLLFYGAPQASAIVYNVFRNKDD